MSSKKLLAVIGTALLLVAGCAKDSSDQQVQVGINTNGSLREKFYVGTSLLWPEPGNIPVCWDVAGLDHEKQVVKDSVKKAWETGSSVRFTGWGSCTASSKGIRITSKLDTQDGPHVVEFGKDIDGVKNGMVLDMKFQDSLFENCHKDQAMMDHCNRSVAVHEFGHALGFFHEQERQDTPTSCPDRDTSTPPQEGDKTIGKWDLMSIMNYCFPDRFEVYPDSLSPLDKAGLLSVYPPSKATPANEGDDDDSTGPSTQSKDEDSTDESGDDDDDRSSGDDDDDDDSTSKTSKKKKSSSKGAAQTASAGCSAATHGESTSTNLTWLFGFGLVLAARKRKR